MCKPRVVHTTGDEPDSGKVTVVLFEWSIGAMRCCAILLINYSTHVHSSLLSHSAGMNFLLISSVCFHSYQMFSSIFEPAWPDKGITTQCAPNILFFHTNRAVLMLMKLSLSPKAHILFVHVATKVEMCLVTEKVKSKKSGWTSIRWLMVYQKAQLSA